MATMERTTKWSKMIKTEAKSNVTSSCPACYPTVQESILEYATFLLVRAPLSTYAGFLCTCVALLPRVWAPSYHLCGPSLGSQSIGQGTKKDPNMPLMDTLFNLVVNRLLSTSIKYYAIGLLHVPSFPSIGSNCLY